MNYHNITTDDLSNGDGLRVVLWVAGCDHYCKGCQNPVTWNPYDGLSFDEKAKDELFRDLDHDYVSGITLSGGDPLYPGNRAEIADLLKEVKTKFPDKTVWLYTGYLWEQLMTDDQLTDMMNYVDVLVDGEFKAELLDVNYPWAGSTNQRVIDVQKTIQEGRVMLYESH